jgi:hypothetical protein
MTAEAVGCRRFSENLPQNIVWVLVAAQSNTNNVAADLMLKLVQAFECLDLLFLGRS